MTLERKPCIVCGHAFRPGDRIVITAWSRAYEVVGEGGRESDRIVVPFRHGRLRDCFRAWWRR